MQLALFDLDHTLIPFDSGMAWTEWLAGQGLLPADAPQRYLDHCRAYLAGAQDIRGLHRATVTPIAHLAPAELQRLAAGFAQAIAPRLPAASHALVDGHRQLGHRCVLVTATTRFIAEVFGNLFGLHAVLATESARSPGGQLTGELVGEPCWREHKLGHVERWLSRPGGPGAATLAGWERSWFYSDAASDLPLLRAVTDPVAVRPDARLHAEALARGWPVVMDLASAFPSPRQGRAG
jgi:HAD superfamily hydrolase (TIGR01490 family)